MDRRVKSFILTIFGAALLLVVATMGCENPLLGTVKDEVSAFGAGDPEISIKKGVIDIPSGGEVDIGSAVVDTPNDPRIGTFTIENKGSGDLKLNGSPIISIDTADPDEFNVGTPPYSTIASGTNSSFTIEFTPKGSAGSRSAVLTINNNDSDENPYTFTITGTASAVAGPEIQVQQGTTVIDENPIYDFGETNVGSPVEVVFTIYNIGTPNTQLNLTGAPNMVQKGGANPEMFSIDESQLVSPIFEGNNSSFTITYNPTGQPGDNHSATITIPNTDADEGSYTFTITGSIIKHRIYWADYGNHCIQRTDINGGNLDTPVGGLVAVYDVALDTASGKMYWTDDGTNKIQRANLDGSNPEDLVGGLNGPFGIALDMASSNVYYTDYLNHRIERYNLNDQTIIYLITTGLVYPRGIALDISGGKMYWTDSGQGRIYWANMTPGTANTLLEGLSLPYDIALDTSAGKMYWVESGSGRVKRANLDGSGIEPNLVTGLLFPRGIALNVAGNRMYVTDMSGQIINEYDLDGNLIQTFNNGVGQPYGIDLDLD